MAKKEKLAPGKEGRVIRNMGSTYTVAFPDGSTAECRAKGSFRIKGIRTTNPVAVGDNVIVQASGHDTDYITSILPRKNYIIRRASNLSKESHILGANIDEAALVATLRDPSTPITFIDRFLATAEAYSVPAIIIINKEDLWDDLDKEVAEGMKYLYESIGYPVFFTSTTLHSGLEALAAHLKGKLTLLAGNSGVGKSSLINALVPGADLRTGEISELYHTGTHTTTFSEIIPLPQGGEIIDVPGVKGFGTIDMTPEEVSHYFPEIFRIAKDCRFGNCTHTNEPGCAVKEALENHFIAESRYASYLSILEETKENDKYRKPF